MDASLLFRLARELDEEWKGAWIQQAWQDVHGRLILQLRRSGAAAQTRFLLLSPLPGAQGIGTVPSRPPCPPRPLSGASYLRAHVCGGRLDSARCPSGERVVELGLGGRDGLYLLILEAIGRRGNWALVDSGGAVRAAWRWEPADTHPQRPLEPGGTYAPPPPRVSAERPADQPDPMTLDAAGVALEQALEHITSQRQAGAEQTKAAALRRKLDRRLAKIRADLENLADPVHLRARADSLAAVLSTVRKGDQRIAVPDLASGGELFEVELDAALSPGENLNRLYDRARRVERGRFALAQRLDQTLAELAALDEGGAEDPVSPSGLEQTGVPYRRFKASNGWPLWVGRNGKENDRLVREARPWDLWFHAREVSGAHVLLRLPGREARPPEAVVLEAAALAARYSRAAGDGVVDVTVTEAGRLRKPKGASPGRVVVYGERTVRVRVSS